jgi:hypothetical protein
MRTENQVLHHLVCIGWIAVGDILNLVAPGVDDDAAAALFRGDAVTRSTKIQNLGPLVYANNGA